MPGEEQNNQNQPTEQPQPQQASNNVNSGDQQAQDQVTLDAETYNALLDKLDEYEHSDTKKEQPADPLDQLAQEGQEQSNQQPDLNAMTPAEIVDWVSQDMTSKIISPLAVQVEQLKLRLEIDQLTRPKEAGGEGLTDFNDYQDDIYKIAVQNPKLPLKDVYALAKAKHANSPNTQRATTSTGREAALRHLPPRVTSERPGVTAAATSQREPQSLTEAAKEAYKEVMAGLK